MNRVHVYLGVAAWLCLFVVLTGRSSIGAGDDIPLTLTLPPSSRWDVKSVLTSANPQVLSLPLRLNPAPSYLPKALRRCHNTSRSCTTSVLPSCHNKGVAGCLWDTLQAKECGFNSTITSVPQLRSLLNGRTIFFQGDSTLRDVFNGLLGKCCFGSLPKKLANMRLRAPRLFQYTRFGLNITLLFRFDFDPEHLSIPILEFPHIRSDAVIVSVGTHVGFNATRQRELPQGIEPLLQNSLETMTRIHGPQVPVIFLGQHVECAAMASAKVSEFRKKAPMCPGALQYIQGTNAAMDRVSSLSHSQSVHYVPPLVCEESQKCTEDGMHSRKGHYSRVRADLVLNLVRLLWRCPMR